MRFQELIHRLERPRRSQVVELSRIQLGDVIIFFAGHHQVELLIGILRRQQFIFHMKSGPFLDVFRHVFGLRIE
ncbi:hypothetical protein D3C76_1485640 [compost metagenome]